IDLLVALHDARQEILIGFCQTVLRLVSGQRKVQNYSNLYYFERQTTGVSGRARIDTRRVYAGVASVCRGLYRLLSTGQNLARQRTSTEGGRWRQRPLGPHGSQVTVHSRLSEDQSLANHAWLTHWAEPTPDELLDSSLAARLATGPRGA